MCADDPTAARENTTLLLAKAELIKKPNSTVISQSRLQQFLIHFFLPTFLELSK